MRDSRRLAELGSVGPVKLRDFEKLGIHNMAQLARANPERLYERLCEVTGQRHDICGLDVFTAAVAQARNPHLAAEKRNWWYWSRLRKAREKARPALSRSKSSRSSARKPQRFRAAGRQ